MGRFAVSMTEKHDLLCFRGYRDCARNLLVGKMRRFWFWFDDPTCLADGNGTGSYKSKK